MYKRIMVPLDGSDLAQTALPHALELCRALGATLLLLHVRDTRHGSPEAARRFLDFTRRQHANDGVAIETVVREGPVAEAIVRAAEQEQIGRDRNGDAWSQRPPARGLRQRGRAGATHSTTPVLLVRVPGSPVESPSDG